MFELKKIEKRIIEINEQLNQTYDDAYKRYPVKDYADSAAEGGKTKLIRNELETLELKRKFLLDHRESWLPKIIWSILTPIMVSIVTNYFIKKLGL